MAFNGFWLGDHKRGLIRIMANKKADEQFSEDETARRRDEALKRALGTPHKLHSEMKLGKGMKARTDPNANHIGVSDLASDVPEPMKLLMQQNSRALGALTRKVRDLRSRKPIEG